MRVVVFLCWGPLFRGNYNLVFKCLGFKVNKNESSSCSGLTETGVSTRSAQHAEIELRNAPDFKVLLSKRVLSSLAISQHGPNPPLEVWKPHALL